MGVPAFAILTYLAIAPQNSYAQFPPVARIPNGAVGAQVLGRVQVQPDFSMIMYGYFSYMEGLPGAIFAGDPSENTAMLTFSAVPTAATLIQNGNILHGLEKPVNGQSTSLYVYYNPSPTSRDILNPSDFTQGILIATFHSRAAAVNIFAAGNFQATGVLALDTAPAFVLNGQLLSLGSLVNALSLNLSGSAPTSDGLTQGLATDGNFSIPFAGTAYAASTPSQ